MKMQPVNPRHGFARPGARSPDELLTPVRHHALDFGAAPRKRRVHDRSSARARRGARDVGALDGELASRVFGRLIGTRIDSDRVEPARRV
jgi:hypothetical protein